MAARPIRSSTRRTPARRRRCTTSCRSMRGRRPHEGRGPLDGRVTLPRAYSRDPVPEEGSTVLRSRPRRGGSVTDIDLFAMERYQSLYWHLVDYDLSESGVLPMTIRELLGPAADADAFLAGTSLGYPLSEGSFETRANVAAWYPRATSEHVTVMNGGSEANFLTLWTLLEPGDRLAFMVPNYMQGWGLGRRFGRTTDTFRLRLGDGGWALDIDGLNAAVRKRTRVVMVCNPNNP